MSTTEEFITSKTSSFLFRTNDIKLCHELRFTLSERGSKFYAREIKISHNIPIEKLSFHELAEFNKWLLRTHIRLFVCGRVFYTSNVANLLFFKKIGPILTDHTLYVEVELDNLPINEKFADILITVSLYGTEKRECNRLEFGSDSVIRR